MTASNPVNQAHQSEVAEAATRAAAVKAEARALGFDGVAITDASLPQSVQDGYLAALDQGWHAGMDWLAERIEQRRHPQGLWPEARSVVVVAANYGPPPGSAHDPMQCLLQPDAANISLYAQNRDYHDLMKKRLKALARWLQGRYGGQLKVFVDTAPVLEKPLAAQAGLGWQGKHSNLVSREFGSWLFLGELYTELALQPDAPESDHCGSCQRCITACPTQAIVAPYRLDARRCLAYLNNEHKGPVPLAYRKAMGNRVYGCDDCLAVCPWNKYAKTSAEAAFHVRPALDGARLDDFLALDDGAFRSLFSKSPIKRIGRDRFLRNVCIACGNSGLARYVPALTRLLSDDGALVRGAAVWALAQLLPAEEWQALRQARLPGEMDADVRAEWTGNAAQPEPP